MGVPQGSVLGPLLFVIFINDFCELELFSEKCLYADDTTIYYSGEFLDEIIYKINQDLDLSYNWFNHNRLIVNWQKSNAMLFCKQPDLIDFENLNISVDGNRLEFVNTFKLLGVTLDRQLRFEDHFAAVCKKVNYKCYIISRSKHLFNEKFRATLFKLFLQSHFDYCSTLFASVNVGSLSILKKCFKKSIKHLLCLKLNGLEDINHYSILKKFNILPFSFRLLKRYCSFIHMVMNNKECSLNVNLKKNEIDGYLRHPFIQPKCFSTKYGLTSFSNIGVKLLNKFLFNMIQLSKSKLSAVINKNILKLYLETKDFFN